MDDIRIFTGKNKTPARQSVLGFLTSGAAVAENPANGQHTVQAGNITGTQGQHAAGAETVAQVYDRLLPEFRRCLLPKCAAAFGTLEITGQETPVLYVIATVGGAAERYIAQAAKRYGAYEALVADAMADSSLFEFEKEFLPWIRQLCTQEGYGVCRRMMAPEQLPMEVQKVAYDAVCAGRTLGLTLTDGLMFQPAKSMCIVFALTRDISIFHAEHDCGTCSNTDCAMRRQTYTAKVTDVSAETAAETMSRTAAETVSDEETAGGESLFSHLIKQGRYVDAPCGGMGKCGKCKVRITKGTLPVTPQDQKFLSPQEIRSGIRLACQAQYRDGIEAEICGNADAIVAVEAEKPEARQKSRQKGYAEAGKKSSQPGVRQQMSQSAQEKASQQEFGIAIDIGTTTIAMALVCLSDGSIADTVSLLNHQRSYGADVVARIQAAVSGQADLLQKSILQDLEQGIFLLHRRTDFALESLKKITIAGNTTMLHLLCRASCEGLTGYPFRPVFLGIRKLTVRQLFSGILEAGIREAEAQQSGIQEYGAQRSGAQKAGVQESENAAYIIRKELEQAEVILLPGICTFVGADIAAGIYHLGLEQTHDAVLLLDIGTNGEMALAANGRIYAASTAAGPAFEGGGITDGTGSIPGAISAVQIGQNDKALTATIQDAPPVGICGTGVIETVAELRKRQLLDETGRLAEPYFADGYPLAQTADGRWIRLTQQDIRQFQMAKSAIYSGLEILLAAAGLTEADLKQVYLAGGFGCYLNPQKAAAAGIFGKELAQKTVAAGNTSLLGAVDFLTDEKGESRMQKICTRAQEKVLAQTDAFQEAYISNMNFK